ncbi:MAG: hypothetical protein ACTSRS_09430 [Candidatus Helarchaeota archaeon]
MSLPIEIFYHELEIGAKTTMIVFCLIFAVIFWRRSRTADYKSAKMMFIGQGFFVFAFGITRILFVIADYYRPDPEYSLIVIAQNESLHLFLWKLSSLIGILAIIFLLLVIETYLVKSRYIFTIIASVGIVTALLLPDINQARLATYISTPLALAGVIILYSYLFFKSSGEIRKKAGLSLDGFILFGLGTALDSNLGKQLFSDWFNLFPSWQLSWLPVLMITIGLAVYTYYNIKT